MGCRVIGHIDEQVGEAVQWLMGLEFGRDPKCDISVDLSAQRAGDQNIMTMIRILRCVVVLAVAVSVSGCISKVDGQLLASDLYGGVFFVEKQPNDSRDLHADIAAELKRRGIDATSGEAGSEPENFQYRVSYVDRWQWDMRMYLVTLRIEVRDRGTSRMVGYGESHQTSLAAMGKSHHDVIGRALDQMLTASP